MLILSHLSKIIEKPVVNHSSKPLSDKGILISRVSAGNADRSLLYDTCLAFSRTSFYICTFSKSKKASGTVNHFLSLKKLHHNNVCGCAYDWFHDCFTGCKRHAV